MYVLFSLVIITNHLNFRMVHLNLQNSDSVYFLILYKIYQQSSNLIKWQNYNQSFRLNLTNDYRSV